MGKQGSLAFYSDFPPSPNPYTGGGGGLRNSSGFFFSVCISEVVHLAIPSACGGFTLSASLPTGERWAKGKTRCFTRPG